MRVLPPPDHPAALLTGIVDSANQLGSRAVALQSRAQSHLAWYALLSYFHTVSEPLVVVCAYCGRARSLGGEWVPTLEYMRDYFDRSPWLIVSHGCCPACLETQMPKQRPRRTPAR